MANLKRSSTPDIAEAVIAPAPLSRAEQIRQAIEGLAKSGGGEIAYLREFFAAELREMFPQTADLHPSVRLFALFGADGTPLMLADSRDAVISGAWNNELTLIKVH
jgi:hypothetical protein